ncbi:MAG: hypothetical protein WBD20_16550 [Pirellulaceae bacterium]
MKRFAATIVLAIVAAVCTSESASAQQPCGFGGFQPFGFYQPYGARYGASMPTPPYFALNPPVYYGARYARPYGISPFASPPVVTAPTGYQGQLRPDFQQSLPYSGASQLHANPHVSQSNSFAAPSAKKGEVQFNHFVATEDKLARQ